jgi:hypothetical protein
MYLFIYALFNFSVSKSDYIASNIRLVNNELKGIRKETAMDRFKILTWYLPRGSKE